MSKAAMFEGRIGVLSGFGGTTVIEMMRRMMVMVSGNFVLRCRRMMKFAGRMCSFCHNNLLGLFC
jgi:hypothetical protein